VTGLRAHLTRVLAPARWALRAHWVTAALLVAAGAIALFGTIVVSRLVAPTGMEPRIVPSTVPVPDLQLLTSALATTPAVVRWAATQQLFALLLLVASGVGIVAAITIIAVAAARTSARAQELVMRRAVGASRRLLLAAALAEAAVVTAVALALGGTSGLAGSRIALARWPGPVTPGGVRMTAAVVAALMALLGLGLVWPVTGARRLTPLGGRRGMALELVLPALQLGVSLTVLAAAALLVRHAAHLAGSERVSQGNGELFAVKVATARPAERSASYAALLRTLHGGLETRSASLTSPGALVGSGTGDGVLTDCGQCFWGGIYVPFRLPYATHYLVSADTFRMLQLPVVAGRALTDTDDWNAPRVAVISRSLAADDFQEGQAVGRHIQIGHAPATWYTVIGVVADQLPAAFGGGLQSPYAVYLSVLQHPARAVDLLVRAPGASRYTAAEVRHALTTTLGPGITVAHQTEAQRVAREAAPIRWFGDLFGVEGWVLLAIATLGTFVVMWLWVGSVSHDLALRRAVGARRRAVIGYVLARAAAVAVGGVAVGLWCGMTLWGALTTSLAGLPPWEPGVLLRYSVLLSLAAVAGALLPAWRVARTAPAVLLAHGDP
jgi:putative ABC transport system permease protein